MKYLYFTSILLSLMILLGCSNNDVYYEYHHAVPKDDIASSLKLMPVDDLDMSNPTGNKKLSDDIENQMPLVKI